MIKRRHSFDVIEISQADTMANKLQERIYFEWFIEKADLNCRVLEDDRESPDFIVEVDGIRTGIEVTHVFSDSTVDSKESIKKKTESLNSKWLSKLAQKYYETNSVPISLSIALRNPPTDLEELTEPIIRGLNSCQLNRWEEGSLHVADRACELNIVRLDDNFQSYDRWKIINDHVTFAPPISVNQFERALTIKTAKIKNYLQSCDRIWLLTVADTTWNSGRFDIRSLEEIETKFDELWFAHYPRSVERLTR